VNNYCFENTEILIIKSLNKENIGILTSTKFNKLLNLIFDSCVCGNDVFNILMLNETIGKFLKNIVFTKCVIDIKSLNCYIVLG